MAYGCLLSRAFSTPGASRCTRAWLEPAARTGGEAVLPANPVQPDCFSEPKAVTWVPRQASLGDGRAIWNNTDALQRGLIGGIRMDVFACVRTRVETREFKPDPVPEAAIRKILEAGRWSPSQRNRQPWHFIVIQHRETLQQL